MTNDEKFRSIVAETLSIPAAQVTDDLTADGIDTWDSLNHINLIGALEQEFGLMLDTQHLAETQSVGRLKAVLAERGVEF